MSPPPIPAPPWQPPDMPVTEMNCKIPLAGFGPVARPWRSPLKYAGTTTDVARVERTGETPLCLPRRG